MTTPKTTYRVRCFVCLAHERQAKVMRFGLRMSWTLSGKPAHRMAGGIYLCETCWKAAQATRPRRGPRPGYWRGGRNHPGKKGFQPSEPTESVEAAA